MGAWHDEVNAQLRERRLALGMEPPVATPTQTAAESAGYWRGRLHETLKQVVAQHPRAGSEPGLALQELLAARDPNMPMVSLFWARLEADDVRDQLAELQGRFDRVEALVDHADIQARQARPHDLTLEGLVRQRLMGFERRLSALEGPPGGRADVRQHSDLEAALAAEEGLRERLEAEQMMIEGMGIDAD